MKRSRKLRSIVSTAVGVLLFFVPASRAQISLDDSNASSTQESEKAGTSAQGFGAGRSNSELRAPFKSPWVGQFSVGEVRDSGILNGIFPDKPSPALTDTEVSSSIAYDLRQKHSDYHLDYRIAARHYNQYPQLDVLSHELGLKQVLELGPRTTWNLNYRYSMTPYLGGSLMGDTLSNNLSFLNPLPVAGIQPTPVFGAPFRVLITPTDELIALRSMRMLNIAQADFTHGLSSRTELAFQAGFSRQRFEDQNLFGTNQYTVLASIQHMLTPRTSWGIGFQGGRMDVARFLFQTTHEAGLIFFKRQLGRRAVLSLNGGPASFENVGQQEVPLPSLLVNLLDRLSLQRRTSAVKFGWLGSATLSANIHNVGIIGSYDRSITGTGGLGGASITQRGTVSMSRKFRQKTDFSLTASYGHFQMLGIRNATQLDQQGLTATLTRRLTRTLDVSTSFVYAKVSQLGQQVPLVNGGQIVSVATSDLANLLAVQQGVRLLNHNQMIVRFVYHFPRLSTDDGS